MRNNELKTHDLTKENISIVMNRILFLRSKLINLINGLLGIKEYHAI